MATYEEIVAPQEELARAYRETALLLSASGALVELVSTVGRMMGLETDQIRRLELGALLHDVGKVGVPKEILDKEGPLSPEERAMIEQHPVVGQAMLENVGGLLGEVALIVRSSHERFDGRGYPDGLAGEAVPIESRIISCCDAFQAMTTDRPYRAALPWEEALSRLRKHRGTQFDPEVVDALVVVARIHRR